VDDPAEMASIVQNSSADNAGVESTPRDTAACTGRQGSGYGYLWENGIIMPLTADHLSCQMDVRFCELCVAAGLDVEQAKRDAEVFRRFLQEDIGLDLLMTEWARVSGCLSDEPPRVRRQAKRWRTERK
jgi:hypothetical protein